MKNLSVKILGSAMIFFIMSGFSLAQETQTRSAVRNQEQNVVKEQNAVKLKGQG